MEEPLRPEDKQSEHIQFATTDEINNENYPDLYKAILDEINQDEFPHIYNRTSELYWRILTLERIDISTKELNERTEDWIKNGEIVTKYTSNKLKLPIDKVRFRALDLFKRFDIIKQKKSIREGMFLVISEDLVKTRRKIRDRGLDLHVFKSVSLAKVVAAISKKHIIDEVDISEKIKDSSFRFITEDDPILSSNVSEMLAIVYKDAKKVTHRIQKMGTEKLRENADDFAKKMYEVVKKIQKEEKISSFRETVKALNKNNIPSFRGGEWHVNTLQLMQKRWKELGMLPPGPKPKELG